MFGRWYINEILDFFDIIQRHAFYVVSDVYILSRDDSGARRSGPTGQAFT